jgi:hypothetical protein
MVDKLQVLTYSECVNQQQNRKDTTMTEMQNALGDAMECSRPFSRLMNRKVQAGVFLWYSQEHFNKYELPKRLARVAA